MNEAKLKQLEKITRLLNEEMVNPTDFVKTIDLFSRYIQTNQDITAQALSKLKELYDNLDSSLKSYQIDAKFNNLSKRIEALKAKEGKQGIAGKDANPEEIARQLKSDINFINLLRGRDGTQLTAKELRDKLESLNGDERLNVSAINGLEK